MNGVLRNTVLHNNNLLLYSDEETACTVLDFIPFADLEAFPDFKELDHSKPDSFSNPISIPRGLLAGDQSVTTAYVIITTQPNR